MTARGRGGARLIRKVCEIEIERDGPGRATARGALSSGISAGDTPAGERFSRADTLRNTRPMLATRGVRLA